MHFPSLNEQLDLISKNTVEIISTTELEEKIQHSLKTQTPLKVKLGADPSRPDLHIGHAVVLKKLRDFQDLGHTAILLIGDFTAQIGDPSGKSKTRPQLTHEETRINGQSYFEQAAKILDTEKTIITHNADWLGTMTFADVIRLTSHYTVARMLERDDFEKRYKQGEPIAIHEFLYPLAQAMDSVHLQNDVELGGTDQKFNLLVGRDLQREYGQAPQVCITLPILEGTDGVQKMSKSLGNAISFTDSPADMFGRVLSIPDILIENYFKLATRFSDEKLEEALLEAKENPRDAKRRLAREIVAIYHSETDAQKAQDDFDRIFIRKEAPSDVTEVHLEAGAHSLIDALVIIGATASKGEARRLMTQGGVSIDNEKIEDAKYQLTVSNEAKLVKVGKRKFYKVTQK
ncbi:tyrosyl-tRNA synthetase [Chloroherpeton thalassium ATCC 35110]|uniref:Tyrosine--tRNA ligase n=1 Tax=Chloroherpeton thalassium (strain ATCC 35110 / GB-78) TaxID=517418 RepID=B3QWJ4_CHLT3|nr:tyrosine--tRNA ligase [Chloroherpeton thalassium]ACF14754.1 tyrosyl-tRNA synthetase [Chloroherpeton thalassium ATCC 35110]